MFRLLLGFVLAAVCASAVSAAPLEAYGGLPSIEAIEISPDGSKLALTATDGEQRSILIKPVAGGASRVYTLGDVKVRRIEWLGTDHLVITTSTTGSISDLENPSKREYMLGFALDLKTHKIRSLLGKSPGNAQTGTHIRDNAAGEIWGSLSVLAGYPDVRHVDGEPVLFFKGIAFEGNRGVLTVMRANLKTGLPKVVEIGDLYTTQLVLGPDGTVVAKTNYEADSGRWALRLRRGASWIESRGMEAKTDRPFLVGLGREGNSVVVGEEGEAGVVYREVAEDGTWGEPFDVRGADGLIFDPDTHRMIGHRTLVGDTGRYVFFDPKDQQTWNAVAAAFKGERVSLESWTRDRKKIVVLVDSHIEGPGYALVDLETRKAEWIGARYQKLFPEDIAQVRPITVKAADGLELHGYLTLPRGRDAKNLPLVVLPHGGPQSRDTPGFDWWAQAVASRGYAVLQVNFRGSEGFGRAFVQAGYGQWGRKMQTDLSDGVRQLAAEGVIDPKRVCIMGASYGGYAALAGATLDTGVYRCAVAVSGLSDLRRMVEDEGAYAKRYWKRFMGVSSLRDPVLAEISPLNHVDKVSIPILMIHGRDDTVVPVEQSQIMADALRRAGKPHELLIQKGEDHWLSRGETRLEMLKAAMVFVETHNPPN